MMVVIATLIPVQSMIILDQKFFLLADGITSPYVVRESIRPDTIVLHGIYKMWGKEIKHI